MPLEVSTEFWVGFFTFIFVLLALDLGVFNRKSHVISVREAFMWTGFWVSLALGFAILVFFKWGKDAALTFLTGYLLEESLSIDNLFVFIMVFASFKIPQKYQHRLLYWGVLGALIMRGIFIFAGIALFTRFHWLVYVFGAFLVFTGIKMLFESEEDIELSETRVMRVLSRFLPMDISHRDTPELFTRQSGKLVATKYFVALFVIEFSDLIFALDSIPAVLAISSDPFIVYTSNIFAILGLRSLYFALEGSMHLFEYLKYGISVVLVFVGVKMAISSFYKVPVVYALLFIVLSLGLSMLLSLAKKKS